MRRPSILFLALALMLTACGSDLSNKGTVFPETKRKKRGGSDAYDVERSKGVFDGNGLNIFGRSNDEENSSTGSGIAVNSFLWRATLDTVSFMPLSSADPFGGVILTDWHSPPESPNERFKLNVFILDRQLRADGIRVIVFKEVKEDNSWRSAVVDKKTRIDIENRILERARELRIAATAISGSG